MRLLAALWATMACFSVTIHSMAIPVDTAADIVRHPTRPASAQGVVYSISANGSAIATSSVDKGNFIVRENVPAADIGYAGFLYHDEGLRGDQYPIDLSDQNHTLSARSVILSQGYACGFYRDCDFDLTKYKHFACNGFVGDFEEDICRYRCVALRPQDVCRLD